jgi:hypothetical protein
LREGHADWTGIYRAGFRSTEASSRSVYLKAFLELSFEEQTRLLERMQTGDLPKADWPSVAAKDFFRMIRDHTLQGAYSHPKYGGNRNSVLDMSATTTSAEQRGATLGTFKPTTASLADFILVSTRTGHCLLCSVGSPR